MGQTKSFSPGDWIRSAEVTDNTILGITYVSENNKTTGVKITALKTGRAILKVSYMEKNTAKNTSYNIDVIDLESITIPETLTLKVGDTYKFSPIIQDSRMKEYLLEWYSEDTNIATIISDYKEPIYLQGGANIIGYNYIHKGDLQTKNPGTTRIICTYKGISAACKLTVEPIYVSDITFDNANYEMVPYQSLQLIPNVLPANASIKELVWKSTDSSVALVDNKGKVTALKKGKSVITATAADGSMAMGNCLISVNPKENDRINVDFSIDQYAQISTTIEPGAPFTLNVQSPTPDWKVGDFSINGINAMEQLVDGVYTVEHVENPMNIETSFAYTKELSFYDLTTGSDDVLVENTAIRISKSENRLYISNIEMGADVRIYTIGGQLIGTHKCINDSIIIDLAQNLYIIVVDGTAFKIKI